MQAPPSTPVEVVQRLAQLVDELKGQVRELERFESIAVTSRHAAEIAEAKGFLRAEGAEQARRRQAILAAEAERLEADTAEAMLRLCKARIKAIETEIEVGRTYAATVRAELGTLGYTEGRGR